MVHFEELQLRDVATLGCGTFGRVDLAWSEAKQEYYAVKKFNIHEVVQQNRAEYVKREKELLLMSSCPFVVELICTGMDRINLSLVVEFVHGGELSDYLNDMNDVPFFSYDCYLWIFSDYIICGTAEYIAPEVIMKKGYGIAVDWWSLGVLIFELLHGQPPFYGDSTDEVFEAIRQGDISFPDDLDVSARDLISLLLDRDPSRRAVDICAQKWFADVDWEKARNLSVQPPLIPAPFEVTDLSPLSGDDDKEASAQRERDHFTDWCEFTSEILH
ncbi:kinase domain protein [Ostertagia ostertagi]